MAKPVAFKDIGKTCKGLSRSLRSRRVPAEPAASAHAPGSTVAAPPHARPGHSHPAAACADLLTKDYDVGKNTVELESKTPNGIVRACPRSC